MRLACVMSAHAGGSRYICRSAKFRFVRDNKINPHVHIEPKSWLLSFQLRHSLLEQLTIQIETNRHDVAALRGAENTARAANFEISHGDAKTSP